MYDFLNDSLQIEDKLEAHSQIKDYYKGKTVLLTGGTGFLGQLYVEKLLRSDVKEVYFLTRDKKGKTGQERLEEDCLEEHFCKIRAIDPNFTKRIRVILGDLTKKNIGISHTDLNDIYNNVDIVLHAAADVRFDEKLVNLILTNLRGTRELLRIAENIKKLEVFAYISTAYSNCNRDKIEEIFYEPPLHPESVIDYSEQLTKDEIDEIEIITDLIIRPWPNTYVYTKCLSEDLVRRFGARIPIMVIRPTIVISTHEDPLPGWCNNIYGLNGVLVACGMGVLRVMPFNRNLVGDVVCADYVTNSTLVAIWYTYMEQLKLKTSGKNKSEIVKPEVYFVGTSVDRPTLWKEISDATNRECTKLPPDGAIWKQCENDTICPFLFWYYSLLFHFVPALVVDAFLPFTRKRVRFIPIYRKVQKFMVALKFFMQKEFQFSNTNMRKVLDVMSPEDHEFYPSDIKKYDWQIFSYNYVLGLRRFIGKENPLNHYSYRKYRVYCIIHSFILAIFYGCHLLVIWLLIRNTNLYNSISNTLVETYEFLLHSK